jgi:hypothetical protein
MSHDLGAMIKDEPLRFSILEIQFARLNHLTRHLFLDQSHVIAERFEIRAYAPEIRAYQPETRGPPA